MNQLNWCNYDFNRPTKLCWLFFPNLQSPSSPLTVQSAWPWRICHLQKNEPRFSSHLSLLMTTATMLLPIFQMALLLQSHPSLSSSSFRWYVPLVLVAASAIFWKVSKKDVKTRTVLLQKRRKKRVKTVNKPDDSHQPIKTTLSTDNYWPRAWWW